MNRRESEIYWSSGYSAYRAIEAASRQLFTYNKCCRSDILSLETIWQPESRACERAVSARACVCVWLRMTCRRPWCGRRPCPSASSRAKLRRNTSSGGSRSPTTAAAATTADRAAPAAPRWRPSPADGTCSPPPSRSSPCRRSTTRCGNDCHTADNHFTHMHKYSYYLTLMNQIIHTNEI